MQFCSRCGIGYVPLQYSFAAVLAEASVSCRRRAMVQLRSRYAVREKGGIVDLHDLQVACKMVDDDACGHADVHGVFHTQLGNLQTAA